MPRLTSPEVKAEVIRLRVESRLGTKAIAERCGITRHTAQKILWNHPLTDTEKQERIVSGNGLLKGRRAKPVETSTLFSKFGHRAYNNNEKGRIAEAAVLLRLCLHQLEVYGTAVGSNELDWLVRGRGLPTTARVQVRWANRAVFGGPTVSTRRSAGRRNQLTVESTSYDFLIGYDLATDTAHVLPVESVVAVSAITLQAQSAERFDLIEVFCRK